MEILLILKTIGEVILGLVALVLLFELGPYILVFLFFAGAIMFGFGLTFGQSVLVAAIVIGVIWLIGSGVGGS
jgi:hypothetical protein